MSDFSTLLLEKKKRNEASRTLLLIKTGSLISSHTALQCVWGLSVSRSQQEGAAWPEDRSEKMMQLVTDLLESTSKPWDSMVTLWVLPLPCAPMTICCEETRLAGLPESHMEKSWDNVEARVSSSCSEAVDKSNSFPLVMFRFCHYVMSFVVWKDFLFHCLCLLLSKWWNWTSLYFCPFYELTLDCPWPSFFS